MFMKKLLTILATLMATITLAVAATNNPNIMKVAWDATADVGVGSYSLYFKTIAATNYSTTNLVGRTTTNAAITVVPNVVYELYITAKAANNLESDPSNKIRGQNILVNGFGKSTSITVFDAFPTNVPLFQLTSTSSNGIVTGTLPNLVYTPTNTVGKDMLVFKSPEVFVGLYVTNYV